MRVRARILGGLVVLGALAPSACGSSTPVGDGGVDAAVPTCDQECRDEIAVRGIRETMKLIYNVTLQGKPVGEHHYTFACPGGGSADIDGTAFSNADQGTTDVKLTYVGKKCKYVQVDDDADESYEIELEGTITQVGTLAVQPSSSTALVMTSDAVGYVGKVGNPGVPYSATGCKLSMTQNGNKLTATFCERTVGVDL